MNLRKAPRNSRKKRGKTEHKSKNDNYKTNNKMKTCSEHGPGNHSSKECWKLHPELMPKKFKDNNKNEKESHVMNKKDKKMLELFLLAKKKYAKATKNSTKNKRKNEEESDSEESNFQVETPDPSDEEASCSNKKEKTIFDSDSDEESK